MQVKHQVKNSHDIAKSTHLETPMDMKERGNGGDESKSCLETGAAKKMTLVITNSPRDPKNQSSRPRRRDKLEPTREPVVKTEMMTKQQKRREKEALEKQKKARAK